MAAKIELGSVDDFANELKVAAKSSTTVDTALGLAKLSTGATSGTLTSTNLLPAGGTPRKFFHLSAGIATAATTKIWTSQADFQTGDFVNTNATDVVGSVVLTDKTDAIDANVVDHWAFNEGSGTTYNDPTGGRPLTLFNGATWASGANAKFGAAAARFPAATDYAEATVNSAFAQLFGGNNNWTVEFWLYVESVPGSMAQLFGVWQSTPSVADMMSIGLRTDMKIEAFVIRSDNSVIKMTTTTVLETGRWYHVALSRNGSASTMSLFLNGAQETTGTVLSLRTLPTSPNNFLQLNRDRDENGAICRIDDMRVSNVARYNSNFIPNNFGWDEPKGTWASSVHDSGADGAEWKHVSWVAQEPSASTQISRVDFRASDTTFNKNDPTPAFTQLGGTNPDSPQLFSTPKGRYGQVLVTLHTTNPAQTPQLDEVVTNKVTGTLKFNFSQDGATFGPDYVASTNSETVTIAETLTGGFYYRATLTRTVAADPSPQIEMVRAVYDLDVDQPTIEVEVLDKNNVLRTLSSGELDVVRCEVTLEDKRGIDHFSLKLLNTAGQYKDFFEATKEVRVYLGYAGTNTRVLYGIVEEIEFSEETPGRHYTWLRGRGWKVWMASRRLTGTRSFTNKGAGQILKALLTEYLPQATSGLDPSGIQGSDITLDQQNSPGAAVPTLRDLFGMGGANDIDQQMTTCAGFAACGGGQWLAQSFTPTGSAVHAIRLSMAKQGIPGILTMSIRSALTGADLGTITKQEAELNLVSTSSPGCGLNNRNVYLIFDSPVTVTPGGTYYIIIRATAGNPTSNRYWLASASGVYVGGDQFTSTDSGSNWTNNNPSDLFFAVYKSKTHDSSIGQTFTTGAGVTSVSRVSALFYQHQYLQDGHVPTGSMTAQIFNTSGGLPTGSALGTASVPASSVSPGGGFVDFNFDPAVTTTGSTQYYVEFKAPTDAFPTNPLRGRKEADNAYAGGAAFFVDAGVRTSQAQDMAFSTFFITNLIAKIDFSRNDTVLSAGTKLAEIFAWQLWVDRNRVVRFEPDRSTAGNYYLSDRASIRRTVLRRSIREGFANFVETTGALEEVAVVDETQNTDGTAKTYTLLNASDPNFKGIKNPIGTVEVRQGSPSTFVVKEENVDFFVNYTNGKISFTSAPQAGTPGLRVDYTWLRKTTKTANDATSQSTFKRWDLVNQTPHIVTGTQAQSWADGLLAEHKNPKTLGELDLNLGLQDVEVGTTIWVDVPDSNTNGEFQVAQAVHVYEMRRLLTRLSVGRVRRGAWEYLEGIINRLADQEGENLT